MARELLGISIKQCEQIFGPSGADLSIFETLRCVEVENKNEITFLVDYQFIFLMCQG